MKQLIDGISKFRREVFPEHSTLFSDLVSAQHPDALFITCADSRIDPNMITQTKPGDLFICRTVGNLVPRTAKAIIVYRPRLSMRLLRSMSLTSSFADILIAVR